MNWDGELVHKTFTNRWFCYQRSTGRMKIFEGFLKFESVTIVIVNASQYDHLEEVCQTLICIYVCL